MSDPAIAPDRGEPIIILRENGVAMPIGPLSQDVVAHWFGCSFEAAQMWLEFEVRAGRLRWARESYIAVERRD
jgi:hypothetical protein